MSQSNLSAARQTAAADSDQVKPNALIVGPMKAGTSWLYEYLKTRRDVALPQGVKETFFFDQRYDSKGTDWYLAHFSDVELAGVDRIMEVAPTYFHPPEVPRRVLDTLGQIQIIVTLRDPANRAFSLFHHMRRYGFTKCESFRDAVDTHPEIIDSSRYAACLSRWHDLFGVPNVSVLMMEDLAANPLQFASDCCAGLGLNPPASNEDLPDRVNVASQPRNYYVARGGRLVGDCLRSFRLYWVVESAKKFGLKKLFFGNPQTVRARISDEDRRWFIDLIRDDIGKLPGLIDRDVSSWLDGAPPAR